MACSYGSLDASGHKKASPHKITKIKYKEFGKEFGVEKSTRSNKEHTRRKRALREDHERFLALESFDGYESDSDDEEIITKVHQLTLLCRKTKNLKSALKKDSKKPQKSVSFRDPIDDESTFGDEGDDEFTFGDEAEDYTFCHKALNQFHEIEKNY
jgi:hypothetical protein